MTRPEIRTARLRWARVVRPWNVFNNWRHVIFSDEMRVSLFKCDGKMTVWRQGRDRYDPGCIHTTRSLNRVGIMVWGVIGYYGVGNLVEVQATMDRHRYINLLQDNLRESAENIFGDRNHRFVFVQDNAPPHAAQATQDWLYQNDVQVMRWPAHSPDMNIIESVWAHIMVKLRRNPPNTLDELRQRLQLHWGEITPNYLERLYEQLPRRVQALIRGRGYPTKY